jgi:hypothetical protein
MIRSMSDHPHPLSQSLYHNMSLVPYNPSDATPSQPQKRARAGTATVKNNSEILDAPALESNLDGVMSMGFESSREQVAVLFNEDAARQRLTWGEAFQDDFLTSVGEFVQMKLPLENICIARFLHATPDDETETSHAVQKCFGAGALPTCQWYNEEATLTCIWSRKGAGVKEAKRAPKLLGGVADIQWRGIKDRSFVMFATPVALWPPPLLLGPGSFDSTIWGFDVKKESDEQVVIGALKDALSQSFFGVFCRVVSHQLSPQL